MIGPGWLPLLDAALRGALLALLLLLVLVHLRPRARAPLEGVGLALALGLAAQVVAHAPWVEWSAPAWWKPPLVGLAMGNAVLFWLFARTLCDDDFRPGTRHVLPWAAMVGVGLVDLAWLLPWALADGPAWAPMLSRVLFSLPLAYGVLAIRAAAHRWRDDLVERRRWLRAAIVVGGSAYTVGMVLARLGTADGRLTPALAAIDAATLLAIVTATAWMQLRAAPIEGRAPAEAARPPTVAGASDTRPDAASGARAPAEPTATGPVDPRLAESLAQAMTAERAYRDPELSVAGLASRLAVPEYRLRRHINGQLGHRNFNAFLNQYRLEEAKAALADPAQRQRPVLSIALEAGFGSIGPFNRAFKQATGLTPTDFRRQHVADS